MRKAFKLKLFLSGEDETSFRSFIEFPLFVYRLVSVDFQSLSDSFTRRQKLFYYLKEAHVALYFVSHWIAFTSMILLTLDSINDIVAFTRSFMNTFGSFFIVTKSFSVVLRKSTFNGLLEDLEKVFDCHDKTKWKLAAKKHLGRNNRSMKIFALPFFAMLVAMAFPIIPFLYDGSMILTVDYWYPFDAYQNVNYCFAYAWILWMGWNDVLHFLGGEIMFRALSGVIAMEYEFLKLDFAAALETSSDTRSEKVRSLIQKHNKLFETVDKLQDIYSINILSSFTVSSVSVAFTAFQLSTTVNDLATMSFYVPYMAMVLGHIFMLCVSGQKLIDSSQSVADGVYECEWEKIEDEALKKQLILIIQRAQKAKKLSAMSFLNVSLETFTTVSSIELSNVV